MTHADRVHRALEEREDAAPQDDVRERIRQLREEVSILRSRATALGPDHPKVFDLLSRGADLEREAMALEARGAGAAGDARVHDHDDARVHDQRDGAVHARPDAVTEATGAGNGPAAGAPRGAPDPMEAAKGLLDHLRHFGARVSLNGDRVVVDPSEMRIIALTDELKRLLRESKPEIVAILQNERAAEASVAPVEAPGTAGQGDAPSDAAQDAGEGAGEAVGRTDTAPPEGAGATTIGGGSQDAADVAVASRGDEDMQRGSQKRKAGDDDPFQGTLW